MDKWVSHDLNENHKSKRFEISSALFLGNQNYPFFNRILTCDEKWILYDNRKGSAQWLDADKAPQLPKPETPSKGGYDGYLVLLSWFNSPLLYKTRRNHHNGEIL